VDGTGYSSQYWAQASASSATAAGNSASAAAASQTAAKTSETNAANSAALVNPSNFLPSDGSRPLTGNLTITGNSIELGPTAMAPGAGGPAYIDFHSGPNQVDYDCRIISTGGGATFGNGTLEFSGSTFNLRAASGFANIIGPSASAALRLIAGSYTPFIRANSANTSLEWVNSGNTAVNMTLSDSGYLTTRSGLTAAGMTCQGALWVGGQLTMQNTNNITFQAGSYSGQMRGDTAGLIGFINQAGTQWTLQIKDSGYIHAPLNGYTWGDPSGVAGQYNGTGSVGGHTEPSALIQQSNNVNLYLSHTGGGGTLAWFSVVGTQVGTITCSATNTAYNTTSDYRLKENVEDLAGGLDRVMLMRPVSFDWKVSGQPSRGFLAHELEPVEPDAVTGIKDGMMQNRADPDGPDVPAYQQVDLSFCIPDMVAAMQEIKQALDAALARIATLEGAA
jgi:hypothetical protein